MARSTSKRSEKMTNDSVITKADLIKPQKTKEELIERNGVDWWATEEGKKIRTKISAQNQGDLFVQDYTGVNPVIGNINSAQGAGTKIK